MSFNLENSQRFRFARNDSKQESAWRRFWFRADNTEILEIIRIGTGALLFISNLCLRARLEEFYGEAGWFQSSIARAAAGSPWAQSILFYVHSPLALSVLNLALLCFSLCLVFGIGVSWVKWPLFFLNTSFLYRNPAIAYGVDAVLTFLLFSVCLAPVGRQWTIKRKKALSLTEKESEWASACLRLIQIQMAILFFYSGAGKFCGETWASGDAIWIVLTNYEFLRPNFLAFFSKHYWLVNLMTYGTLLTELMYPCLIWFRKTRPVLFGLAVLLHLAVGFSMQLYLFSAASILGHLAFFNPAWFGFLTGVKQGSQLKKETFEERSDVSPVELVPEEKTEKNILSGLQSFFSIDFRTLALFRISAAFLILWDLLIRSRDLVAHYTDFGVLPRAALLEHFAGPWLWSIHLTSGLVQAQAIFFLMAGVFAVLMLVGYRTRLMTILSWIFMVSLQNRNFMILQGGDIVFRMLIFWAMFLPLGAKWSVDRLLDQKTKLKETHVFSMAGVGLMFQVVFVFFFSALHKTDPIWWRDGTAIYYALMIDQFVTPLGHFLLKFPGFLRALTFTTYYLELAGPILFFIPFTAPILRFTMVLVMVGLQIGFGSCLELGLFPWVMSAGWLIFLPGEAWDWTSWKLEARPFFAEFKRKFNHQISNLRMLPLFPKKGEAVSLKLSAPIQTILFPVLIYILLWNIRSLDEKRYKSFLPESMHPAGYLLGVDQVWNMFSPRPLTGDGWFVIPGKLKNGREADLFREGSAVRWEKPAHVVNDYANQHWRKYMMNLWRAEYADHRLYYGRYLCRDWNTFHKGDLMLETFQIYFMQEETLADGKTKPVEKILLWSHSCFDAPQLVKAGMNTPSQ